jgi:AsmA-like C-terminal region/Protein of unknown function
LAVKRMIRWHRHRKLVHHGARTIWRIAAALVTGFAIVAAFFVWLLSRGPLSLDAIAPYVADVLSRGNDITVTIDHTLLTLGPRAHLEVLARGVHLTRQGSGALTLGDLVIEFSARAALRGVIAPIRIVVDRPDLRLERDADGSFHLGVGDEATGAAEDWGQKLVSDLVQPPDRQGSLGYLNELSVVGASLTVDDRALGVVWHAADARAKLTRSRDHSEGNFRVVMGQGAPAPALEGDFSYYPVSRQVTVRLTFTDLKPALWSSAAPGLAPLKAIDLPVSGKFIAELNPAPLTLRDAIVDLSFGKGSFENAALPGGALPLAHAVLQAGYDPARGRINLGLLSLDLGHGELDASGTVDGLGADLLSGGKPKDLDADLVLGGRNLLVDEFPRYWPEGAAEHTRDWVVKHLHGGAVDEITAKLNLHVDLAPNAEKRAQLKSLDGAMKYHGLGVDYFHPLEQVKNIAGTAKISPTEIDFTATGGDLGDIRATGATARFYKLDTHDEQAAIEVTAEGPLAHALQILDTEPLGYAREIGIDAKHAGGNFTAKFAFAFPLIHDLALKDVAYSANAKLTGVDLAKVAFGRDLSDGALELKLDHTKAEVEGTAKLAGVPVALDWRESLDPKAAVQRHYGVKATLDAAQRAALGLDMIGDNITGPVGVDASYDLDAKKRAKVDATLDLTKAGLDVKMLGLKKAPGVPAKGQVALTLVDDRITGAVSASLKGQGIDAKATAKFDDKGFAGLGIDQLVAGDDDVHGSLARGAEGGWRVVLAGRSFDASGLIDELSKTSSGPEPALTVDARLDRLVLGPDRVARDVSALIVGDSQHWQRASIDAKLSDKTSFTLRYGGAEGPRKFRLATDNFGAMLKDVGIYPNIAGGTFSLTGMAEDQNGVRVLTTKADGADYRVVKAPTLARLLSLVSLSGMGALLSGEGIPFNRIEGEVLFQTGKITLRNMRAYGGAIGINASGEIDRAAGTMNVAGTLVPAYTLNSIIGDIPVIGSLLLGGKGQGIFASNFRVFGPVDNPEVSVNVLSTLAQGFLRKLFLFSPRGP